MIYKFLFEKYLINEMISISKENSIFSTRLIFASEISLNLLSLFYFISSHDIIAISIDRVYVTSLIVAFSLGIFVSFVIVKKKKLINYIDQNQKSNLLIRTVSIIYTILTFYFFIINLSRV